MGFARSFGGMVAGKRGWKRGVFDKGGVEWLKLDRGD